VAGYSGKSVVQKLGIKPGFRIFAAGLSVDYAEIVGVLPAGVTLVPRLVPICSRLRPPRLPARSAAPATRSPRTA
jgi:hypothetical protein